MGSSLPTNLLRHIDLHTGRDQILEVLWLDIHIQLFSLFGCLAYLRSLAVGVARKQIIQCLAHLLLHLYQLLHEVGIVFAQLFALLIRRLKQVRQSNVLVLEYLNLGEIFTSLAIPHLKQLFNLFKSLLHGEILALNLAHLIVFLCGLLSTV